MTNVVIRKSALDATLKLKFGSGLPGAPGNQGIPGPPGSTGPVGEGSGGLFFESRAAAAAASIGTGIKAIRTAGFAVVGDNGHGLYERRSTHPYLPWTSGQTYNPWGPRYYRNNVGAFYLLAQAGGGAVSVQPVHTTANQIVVGADGYGWQAVPLNPVYFRSQDRLLADGVTVDATNGGWWELMAEGGQFHIEQFGGFPEYVNAGSRGTDCWQPLEHAKAYSVYSNGYTKFTPVIQFSAGQYWFSKTVEFSQPNWIRGLAQGDDAIGFGEATRVWFPTSTPCFIVHSASTGPGPTANTGTAVWAGSGSGACAAIEGLGISQETAPSSFIDNTHGIHLRGRGIIRKCTLYNISGHAIAVTAGSSGGPGDSNRTIIADVQTQGEVAGHSLLILGSDANACSITNFYSHGNGGGRMCGICDLSSYNNTYSGFEVDGHGGKGVWYLGKVYQQILTNPLLGATPDVRPQEWYFLFDSPAATAQWPAWNSSKQYTHLDLQMAIYCQNANSTFVGGYVENNTAFGGDGIERVFLTSHIAAGGSMALSGNVTYTEISPALKVSPLDPGTAGGALVSQTGVGGHRHLDRNHPAYARHGSYIGAHVGSMFPNHLATSYNQNNEQIALLTFFRETDGNFYGCYDSSNDISFQWEGRTIPAFGIAGPQSTRVFGSHKFFASDVGLVSPNDPNVAALIGARDTQPAGSGLYLRGARYYTTVPTPGGKEGWVVTTGGAIADGAWATGNIGGGAIMSTTSGRRYRNKIFGTATAGNEPAHLSGTQTTGDGLVWTFLANGAPVLKQFGSIDP